MKFSIGEKVAVVYRKNFYDELRACKFVIGKVIRADQMTIKGDKVIKYTVKNEEANEIYCAMEHHVDYCLYEILKLSELGEMLENLGHELVNEGNFLISTASNYKET